MSMNPVEKERMLKYILTTIKEKKITVYAIAKDTNLKQTTLHNIVNGRTKNPHENNVLLIYEYLKKRFDVSNEIKSITGKDDTKQKKSITTSQIDLDKIIEYKIEEVVKRLMDDKINNLNENVLILIRKIFDIEMQLDIKEKGEQDDII